MMLAASLSTYTLVMAAHGKNKKSGKDSASQSGERENGFLPLDSVVIERTR
jgi:hypothetical protein